MAEPGYGFIDVTTMGTVVSHILHTRASHYEWTLLFGVQGAIKREKELALVKARTKEKLLAEGKASEEELTLEEIAAGAVDGIGATPPPVLSTFKLGAVVGIAGNEEEEVEISMASGQFARMIVDLKLLERQSAEAVRQGKEPPKLVHNGAVKQLLVLMERWHRLATFWFSMIDRDVSGVIEYHDLRTFMRCAGQDWEEVTKRISQPISFTPF